MLSPPPSNLVATTVEVFFRGRRRHRALRRARGGGRASAQIRPSPHGGRPRHSRWTRRPAAAGTVSQVRMAEWSKAPDSSSGPLTRAWVRTPLLTNNKSFGSELNATFVGCLPERGWLWSDTPGISERSVCSGFAEVRSGRRKQQWATTPIWTVRCRGRFACLPHIT